MTPSAIVSVYGVIVGLTAISIGFWSLIVHRNHWDANHVSALYIIGSILLVVYSRWTEFDHMLFALVNALLITTILYWLVIIAHFLYREDPLREVIQENSR